MSHWYDINGKPVYTLTGKNGKERKPNIKDARELNLLPSVTTILSILAAPELDKWKINQVLEAAKKNYLADNDLIFKLAFEKGDKAKDFGSELHSYLENLHSKQPTSRVFNIPEETKNCLTAHFASHIEDIISVEKPYVSSDRTYAGIPDLVCKLKDGRICVYDYKNANADKFVAYEKYWLQASAYADIVKADCIRILFVARDKAGVIDYKELSGDMQSKSFRMFKACCEMYHLRNKLREVQ